MKKIDHFVYILYCFVLNECYFFPNFLMSWMKFPLKTLVLSLFLRTFAGQ